MAWLTEGGGHCPIARYGVTITKQRCAVIERFHYNYSKLQ